MEPARRVAYGVANQRFLVTTKETEVKNLVLLFALAGAAGFIPQAIAARSADVTPVADVSFTLRTEISEGRLVFVGDGGAIKGQRSEEHTSELQSLMRISYAVFCLKKKK